MRSVTGNLEKIAKLPNVHVVPELAPSEKLYTDFLLWKKKKDSPIYLCCACEREQMCHRIIVARMLDQWGVPVDVENVTHLKRQL